MIYSFVSPNSGVDYERAEIRELIYAALAQLTPEYRAAIVLKEMEDPQH